MSPRWIVGLCVTLVFAPFAAAQPSNKNDPLRFVPSMAEWVVKIDHPRQVLETVEKNELFQQARKLPGVREYYDATNFQQLYQLIAYFEKQLGKDRNDILDDISAGGIVIAARLTDPKGALLIVQSRDDAKLRQFVALALDIISKELERQESKDKIVRKKYGRFDIGQIGPKLHFALADGALLISPEEAALKIALDLQLKKNGGKTILDTADFAASRKQAPARAMAWTWLHVEELRKNQGFKNGLDAAALDPAQMFLFGGLADLLRRTPYVFAALTPDGPTGYRLGIQMPRGRDGMSPLKHMILPADDKGTLPPLVPPRALASFSFFLDLGQFWDKRLEILGEKNAKGLEDGNKNITKLLGSIKLSKLFQDAGPHQRLVFAQQKESPYKLRAATPVPALALVIDMRDPGFAKDMNTIFRTGALVGTFQYGLSLKETKYKDCDLVSYYFSETRKVEGDPGNARFNFSPTYVAVGDQFVMSATAELARDLIDAIQAEKKQKPSKASMRTQVFASGFADIARANENTTLTQLILAQALPPKTAKEELRTILDWVDRLGSLRLEMTYGDRDFRYDILWQAKKK